MIDPILPLPPTLIDEPESDDGFWDQTVAVGVAMLILSAVLIFGLGFFAGRICS